MRSIAADVWFAETLHHSSGIYVGIYVQWFICKYIKKDGIHQNDTLLSAEHVMIFRSR